VYSQQATTPKGPKKISFFFPSIGRGGIGQVFLALAREFSLQGHQVELVVQQLEESHRSQIPDAISVYVLKAESTLLSRLRIWHWFPRHTKTLLFPFLIPFRLSSSQPVTNDLRRYLDEHAPDLLYSAKPHTNVLAIMAGLKSIANTKIIITEHTALSTDLHSRRKKLRFKNISESLAVFYPMADELVTVSHCAAKDLVTTIKNNQLCPTAIYNPIPIDTIREKMSEPLEHRWLTAPDTKVILAVGRLENQKDFPNLLHALSEARKQVDFKLIILGEGKRRKQLEALISQLNLNEHVEMPGHVENPYAYMYRSDLFVLSSLWEGLPTVLIEALACECKVISTDCPCGPMEILEDGSYGNLVPVADSSALAEAVLAVDKTALDCQRQLEYLDQFRPHVIAKQHQESFFD
jgi:glycosyltransferase involved in cell wall biosynthesis